MGGLICFSFPFISETLPTVREKKSKNMKLRSKYYQKKKKNHYQLGYSQSSFLQPKVDGFPRGCGQQKQAECSGL